jgi:hypothetical protein
MYLEEIGRSENLFFKTEENQLNIWQSTMM